MITKCLGLALIASLCFLGTGYAQTPGAAAAVSPAAAGASAANASTPITTNSGAEAITAGWHYVHATNCLVTYDGVYSWLSVYPAEGGSVSTAFAPYQAVLAPACQSGNWIAFYVYNDSGNWNSLLTFNFK